MYILVLIYMYIKVFFQSNGHPHVPSVKVMDIYEREFTIRHIIDTYTRTHR